MFGLGMVLTIIFLVCLIIGILKRLICAARKTDPKKAKKLIKVAGIGLVIGLVLSGVGIAIDSSGETPEATPTPPAVTEEPVVPEISEEEYKAMCGELPYKDLLRTPDDYIGSKIVLTVRINQILNEDFFSDEKYYVGLTDNDGYEWYVDDKYVFTDGRQADDLKILEDDIVQIYGEFTGLKTFSNALTSADEEVPVIDIKYLTLIAE